MSFGLRDDTPPLVGVDGSPTPVTVPAGGSVELAPDLPGRVAVVIVNLSSDPTAAPLWLDFGQGPTLPLGPSGPFGPLPIGGPITVHNPGAVDTDATYQGFGVGA